MKRSVMMAVAAAVTAALFFVAGSRPGAASGSSSVGNRGSAAKALQATAKLESKSGSSVTGEAEFTEKNGGVEISIQIKGAKPGTHGVHLHDKGDCSAPDAASAGGHFNPDSKSHGAPNVDPHHAGDFGNLTVGANGTGKLKITVKGLTVAPGPHSVVGHAVVIHADTDDMKSQPAGNAGARVACGVVQAESK
ncbi:MAG TPA: superoxide dismutase family protein [Blastocatellia bacterium]|nr:superoxide dismutase family protein [Blastocatellia bacterium]